MPHCPSNCGVSTQICSSRAVGTFFADVLRVDGQLAVPAVDHHGQPDACRAAEADDGHSIAARAVRPVVDDVIHKDDGLSGNRRRELRRPDLRQIAELAQVVAVQRDVQRLDRRPDAAEALHEPGQLLGQRNAAPQDADEQNLLRLRIVLQYLMRQAAQGALKRGCIRDLNSLHGFSSRRAQNALPQYSDRAYESTAKRQTGAQTLCISHSRPCRSLCTALKKNFFGRYSSTALPRCKAFFRQKPIFGACNEKSAPFSRRALVRM